MRSIGADVHKRITVLCTLEETGELRRQRVQTTRERLLEVFGKLVPGKVLMEASTVSGWVAEVAEEAGLETVVADPNYVAMYGQRNRRVKTDDRDAEALAIACRSGTYRSVYRPTASERELRQQVGDRATLVRLRTCAINRVRATLLGRGYPLAKGNALQFTARVRKLELDRKLATIVPLLETIDQLSRQIAQFVDRLAGIAKADPVVRRLMTTPGVGKITALTYRAVLGNVERFQDGHRVASYLGLVPSEYSSGGSEKRGRITKKGCGYARYLLVEAAHVILQKRVTGVGGLRAWGLRIAIRKGRSKAVVAVARKLAGILFALWRDGTEFRDWTPKPQKAVVTKIAA